MLKIIVRRIKKYIPYLKYFLDCKTPPIIDSLFLLYHSTRKKKAIQNIRGLTSTFTVRSEDNVK